MSHVHRTRFILKLLSVLMILCQCSSTESTMYWAIKSLWHSQWRKFFDFGTTLDHCLADEVLIRLCTLGVKYDTVTGLHHLRSYFLTRFYDINNFSGRVLFLREMIEGIIYANQSSPEQRRFEAKAKAEAKDEADFVQALLFTVPIYLKEYASLYKNSNVDDYNNSTTTLHRPYPSPSHLHKLYENILKRDGLTDRKIYDIMDKSAVSKACYDQAVMDVSRGGGDCSACGCKDSFELLLSSRYVSQADPSQAVKWTHCPDCHNAWYHKSPATCGARHRSESCSARKNYITFYYPPHSYKGNYPNLAMMLPPVLVWQSTNDCE